MIGREYGRGWNSRAQTHAQRARPRRTTRHRPRFTRAGALEPILNPDELGSSREALEAATGLPATSVAAALASYVRTIRSGNSRFDRFLAGDASALTPLEQEGLRLFHSPTKGGAYHSGSAGSGRVQNANPAERIADWSLYARRQLATLENVVDYYASGGRKNPYLDHEIAPRNFTGQEKCGGMSRLRSRALASAVRASLVT